MKKRKFTIYNRHNAVQTEGEINEGPSQTIENDAMSIEDIIRKSAAGIVDIDQEGFYLDADINNIDKFFGKALDLTDMQELEQRITKLQTTLGEQVLIQQQIDAIKKEEETTQEEPPKEKDESNTTD